MKVFKVTESEVLSAVCDYLAFKGYVFWRTNNIPAVQKDKYGLRMRRMPKYSMLGVSDLIVLKDGKAVFIECKAGNGRQSESQKEFERLVKGAGCRYLLVKSLDDLTGQGL